jgi:hypothetical protein
MNDVKKRFETFDRLRPFAGQVPKGFLADSVATLTVANFRTMWGADPACIEEHFLDNGRNPGEASHSLDR